MLLQIYNLDNPSDEIPLCVLSPGEHIIGRGDLLKIHQNPCFYQSAESTTVTILTKDVPAEIRDGDKFGIFPDQFWFKTKFLFDTKLPYLTSELNTPALDVENIPIHKRQLEDNLDNIPSKISKFENHQLASTSNGNHERNESTCETFAVSYEYVNLAVKDVLSNSNVENEPTGNCKLESDDKTNMVDDAQTTNNMSTSDTESHKHVEIVQNITSTDQPIPSSSGTVTGNPIENNIEKKLRDRCWYGKGCYRLRSPVNETEKDARGTHVTQTQADVECLLKENIDISKYYKLIAFLKRKNDSYMPKKAAVFEEHHIRQFITDAPDEVFLPIKAILIIGIAGACRTDELCNMKVADVDLRDDIIVINIPHTKNKSCRKFVIVEPMWIDAVTRYLMIRPSPDIPRLFIGFRSGKPTRQNMGHNTISKSAIKIATYLKLPDANNYTGHSFRRTSATILADNGGDILSLKRHGGWKSSTVAEGYVEDSITDKKRIASIVQGTTVNYEPDLPPSTSIFEVTPSTSTSVSKSNTELNIPVENFTSNTGTSGINMTCHNCTINYYFNKKSAHHKKEFSHPDDSDYDSDPNDTRPICRYGAECYRKNADHIKEYKHARITRKPSRKRRDKRKLKGMKKASTTTNEWSDDNDYDYDDPFLNDDSEDNYEEESWSEDDSDEERLGSGDEDSDDTNSLMKEAKRFTKQNKK
ncbi:hypothetical protein MML48_2g00007959 [Holotrichia oblita]|uniref:Uncharacterized protein n=1 Tax=Holotrichia oblita TaxID=644536 RepID=A0ACB9TM91_HOLOL|nr:hypothetical protein MML48_2g00007959 [Holotrichia oblita]